MALIHSTEPEAQVPLYVVHFNIDREPVLGDNLYSGREYKGFAEFEQALEYVRDAHKTPDNTPQRFDVPYPRATSILTFMVTEKERDECVANQGTITPRRMIWEPKGLMCTVVFAADKHNQEEVLRLDGMNHNKARGKVRDVTREHMKPFYQEKFEESTPLATFSTDPKYTVYALTRINRSSREDVSVMTPSEKAPLFVDYDSILQYAQNAPRSQYGGFRARQDKKDLTFVPSSPIYAVHEIHLPVEMYNQLTKNTQPNGCFAQFSEVTAQRWRVKGQQYTDNCETHKVHPTHSVIFGADVAGPLQVFLREQLNENFASSVAANIIKRNAILQDTAQKQWDAMRTTPKQYPYQSPAERAFVNNDTEMSQPGDVNIGWKLIARWSQTLTDKGYSDFATELRATYQRNVERLHDYENETRKSAYRAIESVFGKVQREAVKRGDFQTATAAQHVVRGAQGALDDMRLSSENQRVGITREEAAECGIHIPEQEEVCV